MLNLTSAWTAEDGGITRIKCANESSAVGCVQPLIPPSRYAMDDYLDRQVSEMHRLMDDYKNGRVNLNAFIQRIEAISSAIDLDSWGEAISPIVLEMEQVNASVINEKRNLTATDEMMIEKSLNDLGAVIQKFKRGRSAGMK